MSLSALTHESVSVERLVYALVDTQSDTMFIPGSPWGEGNRGSATTVNHVCKGPESDELQGRWING